MRWKSMGRGLVVAAGVVLVWATTGFANLLENGGFEMTPAGTSLSTDGTTNLRDTTSLVGWRFFAINGANASAVLQAGVGVGGGNALALYRGVNATGTGPDTALDRDDPSLRIPIPQEARIYKFTLQGKDGGQAGATPTLKIGSQFFSPTGTYNSGMSKTVNWNPAADWETYGVTCRTDNTIGLLSTRIDMGGTGADQRSALVDNVNIEDATLNVNRLINGGFEGSTSRVLAWRTFGTGATVSATLNSDAHSGSEAALFNVTNVGTATDIGFDFDANRVATLGGETVRLSFAAKKVSGGDIQLAVEVPGYDAANVFQGAQLPGGRMYVTPGSAGYDVYSVDFPLGANINFAKAVFSIRDATGAFQPGSFLIDDVSIMGVPEPCSLLLLAGGLLATLRRRRA